MAGADVKADEFEAYDMITLEILYASTAVLTVLCGVRAVHFNPKIPFKLHVYLGCRFLRERYPLLAKVTFR